MKKVFIAVVGVGLDLLTKIVGALLFVVTFAGTAIGQTITINVAYNLTWQEENADCDGNYVFSATGQWGAFNIKIGDTDLSNLGYTYTGGHLQEGLAQNCQLNTDGKVYFLVNTSNKTITSSKQKFKCSNDGPVVIPTSEIITINDITVGNVNGETIEKLPCSDKALFHVTGGNNGIYIFAKGKNIIDDPSDYYTMSNPQNIEVLKWSNSFFNKKNCYYTIEVKESDIEVKTYSSLPECGPKKPVIPTINDVCIESVASLAEPTVTWGQSKSQAFWSKDGTTSFTPSSSTLNIGDEFYYVAIDANGADPVLSNKIKVMGKPSISPIGDISYCAADGGYDLSKHIVTDNGATTTVIWKLNGSTISNSSKPTLNAGDVLSVEATNACGTTTPAPMNVSNACLPKIETFSLTKTEFCNKDVFNITEFIDDLIDEDFFLYMDSYEFVYYDDKGDGPISLDVMILDIDETSYIEACIIAYNENGSTESNRVKISIKPNTPEFTVSVSGNSVMEPLGGSSSSVTYTVTKENECNSDDLEVTLSDDNFGYSIDGNKVIVFLKDDTELGTYETKVKFDIGSESKEESLTGLVAEYPKTFILKKICGGTESDYPITTDENGKLNIQLHSDDNCEYINEGTIECTEFTLTTSASDHFSGKFVNKGTIKADKIYYGTSSKKLGGSDAVYFDCGGTFIANDLEMNYNTITTSLKGTFLINNSFYIAPAQGQNFEISKCTEIKTYSTDINVSGGSMEISIHGHVNTEYFDVNIPNITSYDDAIITVGHLEASNLNLVISESSLLNLCTNPTKGAPDNIGYIYGTVMYLSDESTGWVDDITPITEGDLNHNDNSSAYWTTKDKYGEPIAKEVIPAYKTYQDCIDEKPDASLLGYDDDPFLPKDKEIYQLYNCNPCSKDFEDAKMEIREIHGKTFRLINGELIYCENDN